MPALGRQHSVDHASVLGDADTLVFPEPFFFVRSVVSTLGFIAPQGASGCLKGWHRILKPSASNEKQNCRTQQF